MAKANYEVGKRAPDPSRLGAEEKSATGVIDEEAPEATDSETLYKEHEAVKKAQNPVAKPEFRWAGFLGAESKAKAAPKKAAAKKAPAKRAVAKTTARKTVAKKAPARKAPAKRAR